MKNLRVLVFICMGALAMGCYNATIDTGLTPSTTVIEKKWASGWILGLVPPATVETMEKCPSGVAKVSTKLSFLNMVVSNITFGIYTPMEVVVTCAAGSATAEATEDVIKQKVVIPVNATTAEKQEAIQQAMELSAKGQEDIQIEFIQE